MLPRLLGCASLRHASLMTSRVSPCFRCNPCQLGLDCKLIETSDPILWKYLSRGWSTSEMRCMLCCRLLCGSFRVHCRQVRDAFVQPFEELMLLLHCELPCSLKCFDRPCLGGVVPPDVFLCGQVVGIVWWFGTNGTCRKGHEDRCVSCFIRGDSRRFWICHGSWCCPAGLCGVALCLRAARYCGRSWSRAELGLFRGLVAV